MNNPIKIEDFKKILSDIINLEKVSFTVNKNVCKERLIPFFDGSCNLNIPREYKKVYGLKNNTKLRFEQSDFLLNFIRQNIVKTEPSFSESPYTGLGIYLFIVNKNANISIVDLFSSFACLHLDTSKNKLCCDILGTPMINIYDDDEIADCVQFKKGELIYCGSSKNIRSRMQTHMYGDISDAKGMKFKYRNKLKNICDCYYIPITKKKFEEIVCQNKYEKYNLKRFENFDNDKNYNDFKYDLESYIHNAYGTRFGI